MDCKVEFKGNDSERLQSLIATSKPGPSLSLTEYIVTPGKEQRKVISKKTKYKKVNKEGRVYMILLESYDLKFDDYLLEIKYILGDKKASKEEVLVEEELKVINQRKDSKEGPVNQPSPLSSTSNLGILFGFYFS